MGDGKRHDVPRRRAYVIYEITDGEHVLESRKVIMASELVMAASVGALLEHHLRRAMEDVEGAWIEHAEGSA